MDSTIHHDPFAPDTDADGDPVEYDGAAVDEGATEPSNYVPAEPIHHGEDKDTVAELAAELKASGAEWDPAEPDAEEEAPAWDESMTIPALQEYAKEHDIDLTGVSLKADIVAAIQTHEQKEETVASE